MSLSGVARNDGSQKTHFIRKRFQLTDSGLTAGYKIGRLPSRAFISKVDIHVVTAYNSGTSDAITIGTTAGSNDILASTSVHSTGFTNVTNAAGLGLVVTGSSEVDVYVKLASTGTAATAGDATVVIGYAPDNDG